LKAIHSREIDSSGCHPPIQDSSLIQSNFTFYVYKKFTTVILFIISIDFHSFNIEELPLKIFDKQANHLPEL
jgi:hypothetical protein